MSVRPRPGAEVPELTARVARAAGPKGTTAMWGRDRFEGIPAVPRTPTTYPPTLLAPRKLTLRLKIPDRVSQRLTVCGRYVVTVVAPWRANDVPAAIARGGIAYAANAHTGAVRPLVTALSMHCFTPSSGTASTAALTRPIGADEHATEVVVANAETATMTSAQTIHGEVTDSVPALDRAVVAMLTHTRPQSVFSAHRGSSRADLS